MRHRPHPRSGSALASLALLALVPALAAAAPVSGFREEFPGTSTSSWSGGNPPTNPGTGGIGGALDGYLEVRTSTVANLATNSAGAEYAGDWVAAGVTQFRVWLKDVGGGGNLSVHLLIGNNASNFWSHDAGFVPPTDRWAEYVVDLTSPAGFTQVRGSGSFNAALQSVDRLNLRHDLPPFGASPDPVLGAFGADHILLTNGIVGVGPAAPAAQPVRLGPAVPNPARGGTVFSLAAPAGEAVEVRVLDASGRCVRRVALDAAAASARRWTWDGRDDRGRDLPAGVYRVIATGAAGGTSRNVTLLR